MYLVQYYSIYSITPFTGNLHLCI